MVSKGVAELKNQIEYLLFRKNVSKRHLASLMDMTANNIYNKFTRNSFSIEDLKKICAVLDCSLEISITINDTGEKIYLIGD